MVKSLLSNELKWKRKEAVKAYFRYNSDMLKGNEKKKIKCMFCHNRQVSCRFWTWIPIK